MGVTIGVVNEQTIIDATPIADLSHNTMEYLAQLWEFPLLRELSMLDPYGNTLISVDRCEPLNREIKIARAAAERRSLPTPPSYVKDDGEAYIGDEFGWPGLARVLSELAAVLDECCHRGVDALAVGD